MEFLEYPEYLEFYLNSCFKRPARVKYQSEVSTGPPGNSDGTTYLEDYLCQRNVPYSFWALAYSLASLGGPNPFLASSFAWGENFFLFLPKQEISEIPKSKIRLCVVLKCHESASRACFTDKIIQPSGSVIFCKEAGEP